MGARSISIVSAGPRVGTLAASSRMTWTALSRAGWTTSDPGSRITRGTAHVPAPGQRSWDSRGAVRGAPFTRASTEMRARGTGVLHPAESARVAVPDRDSL